DDPSRRQEIQLAVHLRAPGVVGRAGWGSSKGAERRQDAPVKRPPLNGLIWAVVGRSTHNCKGRRATDRGSGKSSLTDLAKPVGVGVVSQRSFPTGKKFLLQTRIARTGAGSLCAPIKS